MKRLFIFLLATFMILAGCGTSQAAQPGTETSSSAADSEKEKTYEPGMWVTEDRYENEFWDIAFTLPDNWLAATAEELGYTSLEGNDLLSDEQRMQAEKAFEEGRSVNEMGASDMFGTNIIMVTDNFSGVMGGDALTAEQYAKVVAQQLKEVPGVAYETKEEIDSRTIGGKEYVILSAWVEEYGVCQWYAMRKEDSCMLTIICTFSDNGGQAQMEEVLENFSQLSAAI